MRAGEDGGVAVGHGDRYQVAALAFGKPDHRGPVVGADDLIDLPVARLGALVHRRGAGGDVRPAGPRPGVALLPAASAPAAAAQTLSGFHVQGTAVERLVDGLDARRRLHAVGGEVRADRRGGTPPAQLGADAVPQRPRRLQAAPPRPSPRHLGAPLRRRRPVALTAAPGVDLPGHRRGMSTHPTAMAAQPACRSSTSARKISSRSCNSSGAPGMLVPPSVGACVGTGHHDRNRAPTDGTGRPVEWWGLDVAGRVAAQGLS